MLNWVNEVNWFDEERESLSPFLCILHTDEDISQNGNVSLVTDLKEKKGHELKPPFSSLIIDVRWSGEGKWRRQVLVSPEGKLMTDIL